MNDDERKLIVENIPIVMGTILIVMPVIAQRFSDPDMIAFIGAIVSGLFFGGISLFLHRFIE